MKVITKNDEIKEIKGWTIEELYIEYKTRIDKAIEIIDLIKPELWNISNAMTHKLIDIKNILKGSDNQ